MPRVVLAKQAKADLLKLHWPVIDAIEEALSLLEREPDAGYRLRGRLTGLRSLKVGSYRVMYQVVDNGKSVRVAAIRHRSVAYRTDPQ